MGMDSHLGLAFRNVFDHVTKDGVKQGVDRKGLDRFIDECAVLAAATGCAAGFGGILTTVVGVPADLLNILVQQFRVTLAVIYHRKGSYTEIDFEAFMKIVGSSLGIEIGAVITKAVMNRIARSILARMSAAAAGKLVPVLGAAVGGAVNYFYIQGIGKAVKALEF